MKVLVTAALLILSAAAVFSAPTPKCRVCDQPITGKFYFAADRAHGGKVEVCAECGKLEERCFACSLPVKSGQTALSDGRLLCVRCAPEAIREDDETRRICLETREELDRSYARFLTFPATNIVLLVVDRFTLESLFKAPGYARQCPSVFGATQSHAVKDRRQVHSISVLSSLSKPRLEAVAAHEFGHAWLNENLTPQRRAALSPDAIEAFCELIAYQLMVEHREAFEQASIKENPYTRGQLQAFLAAETRHGFNAIVEWLRSGETAKLDAEDPDAVRAVREPGPASRMPSTEYVAPPVALPDRLTLKGISGSAGKRLALINDKTFATLEVARVRLAQTNLLVRCLEIRTNSVLIQMEATGARQELFLPGE